MIIAIGIDAVDIGRFKAWHTKPLISLKRIFSDTEIAYCLSTPALSAERFAARFAAREAFYKTTHAIPLLATLPFLSVCAALTIERNQRCVPLLICDWQKLAVEKPDGVRWHITLSHTKTLAIAVVIAEQS